MNMIYSNATSMKDTRGIIRKYEKTRSSWLNCALRDDEAGHYEAVAVGN